MEDAEAKMKRAYASRLSQLAKLSSEWDPNGMFVNDFFQNMLFNDTAEKTLSFADGTRAAAILH